MEPSVKAVVLAAGQGKRIRTEGVDLPKVMRVAAGKPLLAYVLDALDFIERADTILVVGYKREYVTGAFPAYPSAVQQEQRGTGHAVGSAMGALEGFDGSILVCCGDMPLMQRETYRALCAAHAANGDDCTILSGMADEPLPYGRVVRDASGAFEAIVEERDCTPEQAAIRELNAGVYVFRANALREALAQLRPDNSQGEYYLTDVPGYIKAHGGKVSVCPACTPEEMLGVNTAEQLLQVEEIVRGRGCS